MASTLELLRQIIRQQTTGVGSRVNNLVGPTEGVVLPITTTVTASWRVLQIEGTQLPSLEEFYLRYATLPERTSQIVAVENGLLSLQATLPVIHAVRGVIQAPNALNLALGVGTVNQAAFAVYLDGVLLRSGTGDREFLVSVSEGNHLLEILVAARTAEIQLPIGVTVLPDQEILAAPRWVSAALEYGDVQSGVPAIALEWYTDTRVGGWSVLRRERQELGMMIAVSDAAPDGTFTLEFAGDVEATVAPMTTLYSGAAPLGVVQLAEYDSAATRTYDSVLYTGVTQVRLFLVQGRTTTLAQWLGTQASLAEFREVQRVQRSFPSPTISWKDIGVSTATTYEYVLQAYGLFDANTLSPWSDLFTLVAGDTAVPGSITLAGSPTVLNQIVTVAFTTPTDSDYAGVQTLFDELIQTGTAASATATTVTLNATPVASPVGQFLTIVSGTAAGETHEVLSSVGAVMTTALWTVTPDGTSVYQLRRRTEIITDYGIPDTLDQFSFAVPTTAGVPRYGTFYFLTFDLAGNIQVPATGTAWVYDGSTDGTFAENQPPVVGIRQLTSAEQEAYITDTLNYAMVEIAASDPVDGTTGVILQYRSRLSEIGTSTGGNSLTSLHDTTKTWTGQAWYNYVVRITAGTGAGQERDITRSYPNMLETSPAWAVLPDATSAYQIAWRVGMPAATSGTVLDDPVGTRGRLVSIARSTADNWIQVRALDAAGLASDVMSYTPDFDSTPEFSSVVVRVDELNDVVQVTGAVDDDTRSIQWWVTPAVSGEPSAAVTTVPGLINNLDQTKNFAFSFQLLDGTRRILTIRPWSGIAAPPSTVGLQGSDYIQDLYRTPRTSAVFENRREAGGMSSQYSQVSFLVNPPVTDATTVRSATSATATTLTDTGVSWTSISGIGQWDEIPSIYQVYYVRITAGPGIGQIRKIVRSGAQVLTVSPDWTVGSVPTASSSYVIQRGATLYRELAGPATGEPFLATAKPIYVLRTNSDRYVEFYSVITGVPPEAAHRAQVDQDDIAEILTWTAVEATANVLTVALGTYDDDVKRWQLFAKKTGWPTLSTGTPSATDPLDPDYRRADLPITTATSVNLHLSTSVTPSVADWYLILSPLNSLSEAGPRMTMVKEIVGSAATSGVLSNFSIGTKDGGGNIYNQLNWSHNAPLETGTDTTHTVRVYAYRQDLGSGTEVEITSGTRRPAVDVDAGADYSNANDTATANGVGSILHPVAGFTRGGTTSVTWIYRVELALAAAPNTPLQSQVLSYTSLYTPITPTVSGASASIINSGACLA